GKLRGQRGLEDGQRLPELHRSALEFAQDAEDLLARTLLDLGGDQFGGAPADSLAESERGPAGQSDREGGQLGGTGGGTARKGVHAFYCRSPGQRAPTPHGCPPPRSRPAWVTPPPVGVTGSKFAVTARRGPGL